MSKPTGNLEDDCDRADVAALVRSVKKPNANLSTIQKIEQVVIERQANRINGVYIDLFTASIIKNIYDAVNPENKAKLESMPVRKLALICLKLSNS